MSFLIIDHAVVPRFKAGDMPGGIEAGTDAIIRQLTVPAAEARKLAAEAGAARAKRLRWGRIGMVIVMAMLVLFALFVFVLPLVRTIRRQWKRGGGGSGVPITWVGSDGSRNGSGGGGGGSSRGSGFSGGGGSFGGGGASGSW